MEQNEEMCDQITLYSICYVPGAVFVGLNDLSRQFFIQKGQYNAQKCIEIAGAIIQLVSGYVLVFQADLGVMGAGVSISISQIVQFLMNEQYLADIAAVERVEVSILDVGISCSLFQTYMSKALPNMMKQVLEHGVFIFLILNASSVGGQPNQVRMAIFYVYQGIFYSIGLGLQSASCQFIGYYVGCGNIEFARKYFTFFLYNTCFISIFVFFLFLFLLGLKIVLWVDIPIVE